MIQIGSIRQTDAEEPLEFLVACHGRILERLQILARVAEGIGREPAAALSALRNTIRFFDLSGRLHTEDEEQSVFPRLRPHLTAEQLVYIDSLESEHREKERVYAELKLLAAELERAITPERTTKLQALTSRLAELYRPHISSENDLLVSIGRQALTRDDLDSIRREMQARRQQASALG